jgi:signal transduction histidine kinase
MAHRIVKEAYCIRELARKLSSRVWDAEELRELGQLGALADHVFETSRSFRDSAISNGAQLQRSSRLEDAIAAAVGASCLAETRERVDVDLGRGSAGSLVDPVMEDVLINLLENASAADPGGGRIKIRTRLSESWLEIEVEDRGAGMATETLDRCQELGFSTNSSTGGSGIGLAVAEAAVRATRGEIRIESEPGIGTCVLLRIPKSG